MTADGDAPSDAASNAARRALLERLGVTWWVRRADAPPPAVAPAAPQAFHGEPGDTGPEPHPPEARPAWGAPTTAAPTDPTPNPETSWSDLAAEVAACTRCPLHQGRTQTVFGTGSHQADWLFVGEAPGRDEDRQGEPFVGRAGQLLNAMLAALTLDRDGVYIANVVKCRPPQNRDPQPDESHACEDYLVRQIQLLRPAIIVALGRIAAQHLLRTDAPLGHLRGHAHDYPAREYTVPLVVTYHPAYLLRKPQDKAKTWADLLLARDLAGRATLAASTASASDAPS